MEEQKMILSFGHEELKATMEINVTAIDFVKRLPLKLDMRDLYKREKFAKVHGLHVDQTVSSHDKGDISYWTPGQALVIYYKDSHEYISGLVKIGEITEGVELLENYPGNIEVTIGIEER
ncbi:cyclophilin-like fold protein [Peribacillus sp. JNUCC 23]|uniref:cyclophilin-like fold protein n=1 Tax=Peribacillus sp. NPDC096379 TaxID=3364393 RepID=UPI0037F7A1F8